MRRRRTAALALALASLGTVAVPLAAGDRDRPVLPQPPSSSGRPTRPAPPPPFPEPARIARARAYADRRQGTVALAVVDTRGRLASRQGRRSFRSASVVKAMILVGYLDGLARRGGDLSADARTQLDAMIRRSDNAAATQLIQQVGEKGLDRVASRAGMRDFTPLLTPWGLTAINAEDQARLFARIDALVPARHRSYARRLLTRIVAEQRWGIPAAAPKGATVLFKGGWVPAEDGSWTVHQAGKVETERGKLAVAVLSEGNPSEAYGRETVRGVTRSLVGSRPAGPGGDGHGRG